MENSEQQNTYENLYFYDPRMKMTIAGRLLVRISGWVALIFLAVTGLMFLISDIQQPDLRFAAILIFFFLIDLWLHTKDPRAHIDKHVRERFEKGKRVNVADYVTPRTFRVIMGAVDTTRLTKKNFYLNMLDHLLSLKEVESAVQRMDVDKDEFQEKLNEYIAKSEEAPPQLRIDLLIQMSEFMQQAFLNALENRDAYIEPHDIFAALFHAPSKELRSLFSLFNVDESDLRHVILFEKYKAHMPSAAQSLVRKVNPRISKKNVRVMNRAWTARPTKTLDQFSVDLTGQARAGLIGFLVGHEKEMDRLVDVASRPQKGSALLVGDPGSGKRAMVEHLASRIAHDDVPEALFDKRLVELSIGSLVAGAQPSVLQERMKTIVDEIIAAGNIILFIPDLHNLLKTSGGDQLSAGDILVPYVSRGTFQTIGATDPRDYRRTIEQNPDFTDAFEVIQVKEITEEQAARILVLEAIFLEREYGVPVSYKAVKRAVSLARKYLREKLLPSSATDLLKEAMADAKQQGKKQLKEEDVVDVVERKTEIPVHTATQEEAKKLLGLEDEIHKHFIDQEEAVRVVAQALREYRSGLAREGGPIATFLFVGPTGVGKTELSKQLAKLQFGSEKLMLRFDMSEFQEKEAITRFIGSSDGEVTGQLTEAVRRQPFSLVLLDEFEKAHPDILNLFLQVFDDGRLTDGVGNTVDFTNTIIIATSNAHSDFIQAEVEKGRTTADIAEDLKRLLVSYFKPELLNRFSAMVVFQTLQLEHIERIARLNFANLAGILDETQGIELVADDEAIRMLAERGYDPVFGARPLRRVMSDELKSKLANAILQGEVHRGDKVRLVVQDDVFHFVRETSPDA